MACTRICNVVTWKRIMFTNAKCCGGLSMCWNGTCQFLRECQISSAMKISAHRYQPFLTNRKRRAVCISKSSCLRSLARLSEVSNRNHLLQSYCAWSIDNCVSAVYGIEGQLDSRYLSATKLVLQSLANVASQLTDLFDIDSSGSTSGLSRVSAHLHLQYHQVGVPEHAEELTG